MSVFFVDREHGVTEPQASTLSNPEQWLVDAFGGRRADSGAVVNWDSAMGLSGFWYCVNRISNDVAQLPLCLYYLDEDGDAEEDTTHPAARLLKSAPGSVVNAFHLRKVVQSHGLARGNGRAFIVRNGRQEPIELIPLPHDKTHTIVMYSSYTSQKTKWHIVYEDNGNPIALPDSDVLHIYGESENGYSGMDPLVILRNSVGTGLATEKTAAKFFKNNAVPGIVLEAPPGVFRDEQQAQQFLAKWNEYHAGLDNTARAGLLREGIKASTLTMSFDKAEMLGQRNFQLAEIQRIFGVPMIPGQTEKSSYNTLEQLNRAYLLHCLGPWLKIWTTECANKLLTTAEVRKGSYYFEFDTWELVKPDATQRAEMLAKMVQSMIITPNEARSWEGLPPMEGGDVLVNPSTTTQPMADTPEPAGDPPDQPDMPMDSARKLVLAKIVPMVNAEVRRVREMAGKARNFCDWVNSYYDKHEPRFTEAIVSVGGQTWMGAEYAGHSRYLLIEAAGHCTQAELVSTVDAVTATWKDRAKELSDTILEVA